MRARHKTFGIVKGLIAAALLVGIAACARLQQAETEERPEPQPETMREREGYRIAEGAPWQRAEAGG